VQESKTEIQLNAKPSCWVLSQLPLCYPKAGLAGFPVEKALNVQVRSAEEVRAVISHFRHRDF